MKFEWDPAKATANEKKHSVTFEEAVSVFQDPMFLVFADPDHSINESRFLALGMSDSGMLLMVSYTERTDATRIISARKASRRERKKYEEEDI